MRDVGVVEHSRAAVFLVVGGRKQRNLSSLFVEKWKSFTWLAREEGRETEKKFSQDSLFFTVAVFFHYTFLRTSMLDFLIEDAMMIKATERYGCTEGSSIWRKKRWLSECHQKFSLLLSFHKGISLLYNGDSGISKGETAGEKQLHHQH